jgi:hypothetical protein
MPSCGADNVHSLPTYVRTYTLQPSNKFPSLQETFDVHVDRSQIPAVIIHSITPLWEGFFLHL